MATFDEIAAADAAAVIGEGGEFSAAAVWPAGSGTTVRVVVHELGADEALLRSGDADERRAEVAALVSEVGAAVLDVYVELPTGAGGALERWVVTRVVTRDAAAVLVECRTASAKNTSKGGIRGA